MNDDRTLLEIRNHELTERIKELNCLYGISNLLENEGVSLHWILERAVELIPPALQYPKHACARIVLDKQEYRSRRFRDSGSSHLFPITCDSETVGNVEMRYSGKSAPTSANPFLPEEIRLLKAIAERLGKIYSLKKSETLLIESESRYRILTDQIDEGVTLVQNRLFRYVNPAFRRLAGGYPVEQFLEKSPFNPDWEPIRQFLPFFEPVDSEEQEDRIEATLPIQTPQGIRWITVCHCRISYLDKAALLSTFRDTTGIREQELSILDQAEQLRRENFQLRASLKDRFHFGAIIGRSEAMQAVYEMIQKAAASDISVTIQGESGTGKELVARAIHQNSSRRSRPMISVNCGSIPETLFEREFFGHKKGAFSHAFQDDVGFLDSADGGTLFLDEAGELTLGMQSKLLRAIEGGGYRPVGSMETRTSDFRLISASNTPLMELVRCGRMRLDFFYRIQILQITIPPLRERKEDIPLLVEHFLQDTRSGATVRKMPAAFIDRLMAYDWPGNVRELKNVVQRYQAVDRLEFVESGPFPIQPLPGRTLDLPLAVKELERDMISRALAQCRGNRTLAARVLNISRRALFRKLKAYDLSEPPDMGDIAHFRSYN